MHFYLPLHIYFFFSLHIIWCCNRFLRQRQSDEADTLLSIYEPLLSPKTLERFITPNFHITSIDVWQSRSMTEQNRNHSSLALIAVAISFTSMASVAVCVRLLSRKLSSVRFWWDNGFISLILVGPILVMRN